MCNGGFELESTTDFSLCCQNHVISRSKLLKNLNPTKVHAWENVFIRIIYNYAVTLL